LNPQPIDHKSNALPVAPPVYYLHGRCVLLYVRHVQVVVESCLNGACVARHKKPGVEVIDMALTAKLSSVSAAVCSQDHMVTDIKIDGQSVSNMSCLLINYLITSTFVFSALTLFVGRPEGHPACKIMGGWWRWALVSPDGVAPSRMVSVSASVNLPLHHKVQKFSSGAGSSGWSCKKGCKTVVVCVVRRPVEWCGELRSACLCVCLFVCLSVCLSSRISQEALVQTSLNILYMLPVAMARSCSDDSAVRYVLLVLWTMSCFHIMEHSVIPAIGDLFTETHQMAPGQSLLLTTALFFYICHFKVDSEEST